MVEKIFCMHHRRKIKLDLNFDIFCYEERAFMLDCLQGTKISIQREKVKLD